MSAGSQENLPFAGTGSPTLPQVVTTRARGPRGWGRHYKTALLVPLVAAISVFAIYPFVWLISASLKPRPDVFDNKLVPDVFSWNYDDVLEAAPIATWFFNSVWIGLLGAVAVALSSALVAFSFAYFRFPGRNALFALILATMMLPPQVTMIPVYLLWNEIGKFTLDHAWLPHIGTNTQYPLWVPNLFSSAFYVFLLRQFFLGIPREYFEAARIDGDNYLTMFWRIALPLAKPALIVTVVFELQAKWFDLMTPLIYLRDEALYTFPLGLKTVLDQFGQGGGGEAEWQIVIAATVLGVLPMIIIFAIFQRYFVEGIATQGRKG